MEERVKPVSGGLPMAIQARESGYAKMIVPAECPAQAAVDEIAMHTVRHLSDVVVFLNGNAEIAPVRVGRGETWSPGLFSFADALWHLSVIRARLRAGTEVRSQGRTALPFPPGK
jgi:predicted ATPase with chaperone activity